MKKLSKSHHSSLNELNITPLLDLAFVLLVIFIITTPALSNDLEMNLPTPGQQKPAGPRPRINRIVVTTEGQISINGQPIELPELRTLLVSMYNSDHETAVVVKGSSDVDYQRVINVLDAVQQANITKVGLATETSN